jgi:hypothetical protein
MHELLAMLTLFNPMCSLLKIGIPLLLIETDKVFKRFPKPFEIRFIGYQILQYELKYATIIRSADIIIYISVLWIMFDHAIDIHELQKRTLKEDIYMV